MATDTDPSLIAIAEWVDPMKTRGWVQSGGVLEVGPALSPFNTISPRQYETLLSWEARVPMAVEWEVNIQQQDPTILAGGFPPADLSGTWLAGAYFDASNIWDSDSGSCVICKIELGSGPNARTIFTNLRGGRFALGTQSRVRISVARWLAADGGNAVLLVQSSVAPAQYTDAEPPTYSAQIRIPAGITKSIVQPPGALWVDLAISLGNTQIEVQSFDFKAYKNNSSTAPLCYPPASPWPAPTNGTLYEVTNTGAAEAVCTLHWWIR